MKYLFTLLIFALCQTLLPAENSYRLLLPAMQGGEGQVLGLLSNDGDLAWITTVTNSEQLQLLYTATSEDIPLTLVLRDSTGSFAATTITLTSCLVLEDANLATAGTLCANTTAVILAPQGSRALQASTGGNQRGTNAIDLQIDTNSTYVASGNNAVISGGSNNTASGDYSFVGGGFENSALSTGAIVVGGGYDGTNYGSNSASGGASFVGGGIGNHALNRYDAVVSGSGNTANGGFNFVGGGYFNTVSMEYSFIGGGKGNTASNNWASVVGGDGNTASGAQSFIGGGFSNMASGANSAIAGGLNNIASGGSSCVSGGASNLALSTGAAISGGVSNMVTGQNSTIMGGQNNIISGYYSLAGGYGSIVGGYYSLAAGYLCTATGNYSTALGALCTTTFSNTFIWGDGTVLLTSTAAKTFSVLATNGARFITNSALSTGVILNAGGGSWNSISDKHVKENYQELDKVAILEKVVNLPVEAWNLKSESPHIKHMGPYAQDFYAAFGLGDNERYINSSDIDGVALAAIQGLYILVCQLRQEIADLKSKSSTSQR